MEPLNPTSVMFDTSSNYPEEVYNAFAPVREIYELIVFATEGVLAGGPPTLMEVEAILHSNYLVSKYIDHLCDYGIVEPSERAPDVTLNACVTALLAMKIRDKEIYEDTRDECVKRCLQLVEYIVEDERLSKKETLAALAKIKSEVTKKSVIVRSRHNKPFRFLVKLEKYANREDKTETPVKFLERVYRKYLQAGLKPVHIRYEDEAFYNVLHVWCSRNKIDIRSLFMKDGNSVEHRETDKQRVWKRPKAKPEPL